MRTVLHADLDNFYASVECRKRPELRSVPVIVCGDPEKRHGIVLAKNQLAKRAGVKTGETIWMAKRKCPNAVEVRADFPAYLDASAEVRAIYDRYTDQVEPFGIDECWLDVTGSRSLFGDGRTIASRIQQEVRKLGLTVSVGVSFNKVFAKYASDLNKPDGIAEVREDNFRQILWPREVSELLYVGKHTAKRLSEMGICTVGALACADVRGLEKVFGKRGLWLWQFANGLDDSPVAAAEEGDAVKSIGNSLTSSRDLYSAEDAGPLLELLSDSVAARLRESGLGKAQTLRLWVRDSRLKSFVRQGRLPYPSCTGRTFYRYAAELLRQHVNFRVPVRALGVAVCDFSDGAVQTDFFSETSEEERTETLERAVDGIRKKYGYRAIGRAAVRADTDLGDSEVSHGRIGRPETVFPEEDSPKE